MKLKMNPVVAGLAVMFVIGAAMFSLKSNEVNESKSAEKEKSAPVAALSPETMRALGIEGDTPQDTLNTLVGKIIDLDKRFSDQEISMEGKEKELNKLRQEKEKEPDRVARAVEEAQGFTQQQLSRLQSDLERLKKQRSSPSEENHPGDANSEFPVGQQYGAQAPIPPENVPGTLWLEPSDERHVDRNGNLIQEGSLQQGTTLAFPTAFGDTTRKLEDAVQKTKSELDGSNAQNGSRPGIPFWTLPENSTLMGSVAMTALIGRIPIDGNVTDPYPFKVVIGPDNLTANGIDLPDVEAAIISGTATGDWVLSCVRGTLTSFTLVFSDGRIRTLRNTRSQGSSSTEGIGWLSDDNGIPCVNGERKTNAGSYLPTLFALSGAESAADAMATSQTTATTTGDNVVSSLTGSAGQYALGKGLSGGTNAAAEWFRKRYGQMFDAVYVRPGSNVAIHISQQLEIDYEEDGRLVDYGRTLAGYITQQGWTER